MQSNDRFKAPFFISVRELTKSWIGGTLISSQRLFRDKTIARVAYYPKFAVALSNAAWHSSFWSHKYVG